MLGIEARNCPVGRRPMESMDGNESHTFGTRGIEASNAGGKRLVNFLILLTVRLAALLTPLIF